MYIFIFFIISLLAFMAYVTWGMIISVLTYFEWFRNLKGFLRFEILGENSINRMRSYLTKYSPYYRSLNALEKKRFEIRLTSFIAEKIFIGKEGFKITEKSKVLISAAAIQITFGLDEFMLYHFTTIYVYPDIFYSKHGKEHHRGEVNLRGSISLSWKHFLEGFANYSDQRNLGLHEMAHAVKLQNLMKSDYDTAFAKYYHRWIQSVQEKFKKLQSGKGKFLRSYAGRNIHEFFAVCVEHFFETPEKFYRELPDIYIHFCILLNQNPLRTNGQIINARKHLLTENKPKAGFNPYQKMVYKTNASILKQLQNLYFFLLWPLLIVLSFIFNVEFSIAIAIIIILLSVIFIFIYKRSYYFILYPEHLKIKNALNIFSKKLVIPLKDIVCIFISENLSLYTERLQITFIENGEFKHDQFYFILNEKEVTELTEHLKQKEIPVIIQKN